MVSFDYSKLRGRIVEKGLTQGRLSEELGITPQSFSKKMQNETRFSTDDIIQLSEALEIEPAEIGAYFFTPSVEQS